MEEQIGRLTPALQLIGCVALVPPHPPSILGQEDWPGHLIGQGRGFTAPASGVTVSARQLAALIPLRKVYRMN